MSASRCHNLSRPTVPSAAYYAANIVVYLSCGGICSFLVMQHDPPRVWGAIVAISTGEFCHSRPAKKPTTIFAVQPRPIIGWGVSRTKGVAQQLGSHESPGNGLSQWLCRLQHLLSAVCLEVPAQERAIGDTVREGQSTKGCRI